MTGRFSRYIASATATMLVAGLAACSSGSQQTGPLPTTSTAPTPGGSTQSASAQMVITIPARATTASSVRPKYISASTQSMTIGLSGSSAAVTEVDLTPSSPNCSAIVGGGTKCSVNLLANAGSQTFVLKMYDQTGGKGNLLSTGSVTATLTASKNTSVPVVLDGVVSNVSVVLGTSTLQVGNAGSTSVTVQATDADGNIIVGPGGFSTPVTLAIAGDTYGTLSLSSATVKSPGQVVTLNYTGGTNVGSTITPSVGNKAGTPANFAGTGAAVTEIVGNLAPPAGYSSWLYPADVAALPNGNVGVLFQTGGGSGNLYTIAVGSTTSGFQKYYVGDTTDPYNPSNATSLYASEPGVAVVKGMSLNLVAWPTNGNQEHTLGSDSSGNLYYSASFSINDANDGCAGGALNSGVIGVLNSTAGTTKEYVLKGVPMYMRTDSSGNTWFVEQSGTCSGTNLLASGWGIGELKAGSSTPVETDFGAAGIASNVHPVAMNITPDGSSMFIGDVANETMIKVATAAMTSTTVTLNHATDPYAIAAGPDGTAYWMSGNTANNDDYYYGYIEGSQSFTTANVQELVFPISYFYGYDAVYADGSFWGAGYDDYGFGRISGLSSGKPQTGFYSTESAYYAEPYTLAAGSGYIWAGDDDYYGVLALQYGQQTSATTTIQSFHRIGRFSATRLPSIQKMRAELRSNLRK